MRIISKKNNEKKIYIVKKDIILKGVYIAKKDLKKIMIETFFRKYNEI